MSTREDPENSSPAFWRREERVLTRLTMATAGIPYAVVLVAAIVSLGVALGREADLKHIQGTLEVISAWDAIANGLLQEARETILSILSQHRNFTASRQPKIQDLFARISGSSLDVTSLQQQLDVTRQMYSSPQQKEANRRAAIRECLCAYRRVMASTVTACPKVGDNIVSWLESRIGSDLRQLDKIVKFRLREIQHGLGSLLVPLYLECSGNFDDCSESLLETILNPEPDENRSEWLKEELVQIENVRSGVRDIRLTNSIRIGLFAVIVVLLLAGYPLSCGLSAKFIQQFTTGLQELRENFRSQTELMEADVKQTEVLLCRLLPKNIVEDLKTDKSVLAECYQLVTIYFSDIVGFTNISASSTPMQVVQFLDKLYTEFDSRIDLYDVYKVETIGDAYVIVSGCPRTNGLRHAGELATLALDLLHMTNDFVIPHKPHGKLMLRIGLHSGPCVAAVVGVQMPRYCLLGETVNIASRMESTGQALRIQVTEDCKQILDGLGNYEFKDRGQVEVKENVFVRTYWLTGKDGYRFNVEKDVCLYIPKKVKLDRVVVRKSTKSKLESFQQPQA